MPRPIRCQIRKSARGYRCAGFRQGKASQLKVAFKAERTLRLQHAVALTLVLSDYRSGGRSEPVLGTSGSLGFEPQLLSYRLPVKVYVLRVDLIALNLSERSQWIGDCATGRRGCQSINDPVWVPCKTN